MDNEKKYEEVFAELEKLVEKIEDPERDLTSLRDDIAKALEMIKWCREHIRGNREEIEKLMEKWQ
ncbi:MAG: exodeoxyribonuclease VII small subunit [Bacteroidales bacterium]|jgi:exodeoxyribonuclease VII small subunit|nr:exodeoxyribonuclease VII small subunit [Bacteroidales bacterium]